MVKYLYYPTAYANFYCSVFQGFNSCTRKSQCVSFVPHEITAMEMFFIKLQQISICVKLHIQVGVNSKGNYYYCSPLLTQCSHLILFTLFSFLMLRGVICVVETICETCYLGRCEKYLCSSNQLLLYQEKTVCNLKALTTSRFTM